MVYGPARLEEVLNVLFEAGLGEVADVTGDVGFGCRVGGLQGFDRGGDAALVG